MFRKKTKKQKHSENLLFMDETKGYIKAAFFNAFDRNWKFDEDIQAVSFDFKDLAYKFCKKEFTSDQHAAAVRCYGYEFFGLTDFEQNEIYFHKDILKTQKYKIGGLLFAELNNVRFGNGTGCPLNVYAMEFFKWGKTIGTFAVFEP